MSYQDLLEIGRSSLYEYINTNYTDLETNYTAIEPSLKGKYLDQIYELNKYIYTTASTNYPGEIFQPFFLEFFATKDIILKILNTIDPLYYGYMVNELSVKDDKIYNDTLYLNMVKTNDPKNGMLDINQFKTDDTRKRKRSFKMILSMMGDNEFPNELFDQFKELIASGNLVAMIIEDSDINNDTLYEDLLSIFQ